MTAALRARAAAVLDGPARPEALLALVLLGLLLHGAQAVPAVAREGDLLRDLQLLCPLPMVLTGAWLWQRRPGVRTGPLLLLAGLVYAVSNCFVFREPWLFAPTLLTDVLSVPLVYLLLAVPYGRLPDVASRVVLGVYAASAVITDATLLLWLEPCRAGVLADCVPGLNPLLLDDDPARVAAVTDLLAPVVRTVRPAVGLLVLWHWWRGAAPVRRALTPVLPVVVLSCLGAGAVTLLGPALVAPEALGRFKTLEIVLIDATLVALPLGLAWGVLRAGARAQRVGDLVLTLQDLPPPERLQAAVARALDDPAVRVGVWAPDVGCYAGADGRAVEPPPAGGPLAASSLTSRDGRPLALVVHDAALLDDPALLASVTAAVRLAVDNDRLQGEVHQRLEQVHASRARIVTAAYDERRRLERDLHDGAQQRLVSALLELRLAAATAPDGLRPALDAAAERLASALAELRDLARGVFPATLSRDGLAAALQVLAERAAAPVRLHGLPEQRLPDAYEALAYFAVSEAAAVTAAAGATLEVAAGVETGQLRVEVTGGGTGGWDHLAARLADRAGAVDGAVVARDDGLVVRLPLPVTDLPAPAR